MRGAKNLRLSRFPSLTSEFDYVGICNFIVQSLFLLIESDHQVANAQQDARNEFAKDFTFCRTAISELAAVRTDNLDAQRHLARGLTAVAGKENCVAETYRRTKKPDNQADCRVFTGCDAHKADQQRNHQGEDKLHNAQQERIEYRGDHADPEARLRLEFRRVMICHAVQLCKLAL